jgi:hypothetical protein
MDELKKGMQHITNIKMDTEEVGCLVELTKEALENSETSAVDFVEDFK